MLSLILKDLVIAKYILSTDNPKTSFAMVENGDAFLVTFLFSSHMVNNRYQLTNNHVNQ
jgi:hypothetical protein